MPAEHPYRLDTARAAAERDQLAQWVTDFLASPGSDNAVLAAALRDRSLHWSGPVRLPIRELNRLAGPPGHPVLQPTDEDDWRDDVEELAEEVDDGSALPPVVVTYQDARLVVEDGNHRIEALRRAGAEQVWAVVGFATQQEGEDFQTSRQQQKPGD